MDNITLDLILDRREEKQNRIQKKIDHLIEGYKKTFPVMYKYDYIDNNSQHSELKTGHIIRYTKSFSEEPSPGCFIQKIVLDVNKRIIYLLLTVSVYQNTVFRIYPENYLIFRYNKANIQEHEHALNKELIRKEFQIKGKVTKEIVVPKGVAKKLTRDAAINSRKLDKDVDNLIKRLQQESKEKEEQEKMRKKRKKDMTFEDHEDNIDEYIERYK